jgi:hypothetical protein
LFRAPGAKCFERVWKCFVRGSENCFVHGRAGFVFHGWEVCFVRGVRGVSGVGRKCFAQVGKCFVHGGRRFVFHGCEGCFVRRVRNGFGRVRKCFGRGAQMFCARVEVFCARVGAGDLGAARLERGRCLADEFYLDFIGDDSGFKAHVEQ